MIREIQKYVDGKVLFIPRCSEKAMGWGEKNGAKNRLAKRNKEIVSRFTSGETIAELGKMFFLSEKRIQGIIREYESSKNQDAVFNNELRKQCYAILKGIFKDSSLKRSVCL